jgi:hypothetical protein
VVQLVPVVAVVDEETLRSSYREAGILVHFLPSCSDENLDVVGLDEPPLFSSACVGVESAFKVPPNISEDVDGLNLSFELVLSLQEIFSVLLTTATVNKGLPL